MTSFSSRRFSLQWLLPRLASGLVPLLVRFKTSSLSIGSWRDSQRTVLFPKFQCLLGVEEAETVLRLVDPLVLGTVTSPMAESFDCCVTVEECEELGGIRLPGMGLAGTWLASCVLAIC